jgi:hypothetical protein
MVKILALACCLMGSLAIATKAAVRFELPQVAVTATSGQATTGFVVAVVRADAADLPKNVGSFNVDFHTTSTSLTFGPPQMAPNPLFAGTQQSFSPDAQTVRAAMDNFSMPPALFDGAGLVRVQYQVPAGVSGVFTFAFGLFNELTNPNASTIPIQTTDTGSVTVFPVGDYNQSGGVDAADYTIWRDTLGSTTDLRANGNNVGASAGKIDEADYTVWTSNFGHTIGGSGAFATQSIPEPSTVGLALIACAAFCLLGLRRHITSIA